VARMVKRRTEVILAETSGMRKRESRTMTEASRFDDYGRQAEEASGPVDQAGSSFTAY